MTDPSTVVAYPSLLDRYSLVLWVKSSWTCKMPSLVGEISDHDFHHIKNIHVKSQLSALAAAFCSSIGAEGVTFTSLLLLGILVLIYCIVHSMTPLPRRRTRFHLEPDPDPKVGATGWPWRKNHRTSIIFNWWCPEISVLGLSIGCQKWINMVDFTEHPI